MFDASLWYANLIDRRIKECNLRKLIPSTLRDTTQSLIVSTVNVDRVDCKSLSD